MESSDITTVDMQEEDQEAEIPKKIEAPVGKTKSVSESKWAKLEVEKGKEKEKSKDKEKGKSKSMYKCPHVLPNLFCLFVSPFFLSFLLLFAKAPFKIKTKPILISINIYSITHVICHSPVIQSKPLKSIVKAKSNGMEVC